MHQKRQNDWREYYRAIQGKNHNVLALKKSLCNAPGQVIRIPVSDSRDSKFEHILFHILSLLI
jgi:hypothetical protein